MKRTIFIIPAVMISAIILSCTKGGQPVNATLNFMTGEVSLEINGSKSPAKTGDLIQQGMKVITGKKSFADILIGENSVRIFENSNIVFSEMMKNPSNSGTMTDLKIDNGKIYSSIPKKLIKGESYSVKSQTVVAAVRGTEFIVEENSGRYQVACTDGQVAVKGAASGEEIIVNAGEEATFLNGTFKEKNKISADKIKDYTQIRTELSGKHTGAFKENPRENPQGLEPDSLSPEKRFNGKE